MNRLPDFLQQKKTAERSVCLILEGFEEQIYFERLISLPIFSKKYSIKPINAKSASNIPIKYQEALASDLYSIVLIVCDADRKPEQYNFIVKEVDKIIGEGNATKIITFIRPCTMQVILLHFDEIHLKTQAKKDMREDILRLTGVKDYDAHQDQIKNICDQIYFKYWNPMLERVKKISTEIDNIPSTNILLRFDRLSTDDISWIKELNDSIQAEDL